MNKTDNLTEASLIYYKPRSTKYCVLHHNLNIKGEDGTWSKGCMYYEEYSDDTEMYIRPYDMFDMNKWKIVKTNTTINN